jgi:hypothetical protein
MEGLCLPMDDLADCLFCSLAFVINILFDSLFVHMCVYTGTDDYSISVIHLFG